jgi:hypothetical protein
MQYPKVIQKLESQKEAIMSGSEKLDSPVSAFLTPTQVKDTPSLLILPHSQEWPMERP